MAPHVVTLNAKMRRTGICGAAECLLIDRDVVDTSKHGDILIRDAGWTSGRRGAVREWRDPGRRFPALVQAARVRRLRAASSWTASSPRGVVDGVDEAIAHIRRPWSSGHTEGVITEDAEVAERFFQRVDSAILMWNASTQFADGGEFGMGAEIGIATGKMHARGPVGAEQLTSFKYLVTGNGTVRG